MKIDVSVMKAAGLSDAQIVAVVEQAENARKAKNRERQAAFQARKRANVNNTNNANNVSNVSDVIPVSNPKPSRACSNTNLPSEDIITFPSERTGRPVPATAKSKLWTEGVPGLIALGVSERQARSVIGGWLKSASPESVLDAISAARRECPIAPVPWITAALRPTSRAGPQRRPSVTDAILDLLAEGQAE